MFTLVERIELEITGLVVLVTVVVIAIFVWSAVSALCLSLGSDVHNASDVEVGIFEVGMIEVGRRVFIFVVLCVEKSCNEDDFFVVGMDGVEAIFVRPAVSALCLSLGSEVHNASDVEVAIFEVGRRVFIVVEKSCNEDDFFVVGKDDVVL